jgi:hypothetical protein
MDVHVSLAPVVHGSKIALQSAGLCEEGDALL